jgi:hypothetical protein
MTDITTAPRPMDAPDILPLEFLFAIMHDPTVDLRHRVDAAVKLMELGMRLFLYARGTH